MISHDQCRDQIGEFLDQTLDPSEREKVASHLESCAPCAQIAREMTAIAATMRAFKPAPAPPRLRQNVRAALQNEKERAARPWFAWPWPRLATRQFAWSGTLAFSALALWVLTRPFDLAPNDNTAFESTSVPAPATGAPGGDGSVASPGSTRASKPKNPQQQSPQPASRKPVQTEADPSRATQSNSAQSDSARPEVKGLPRATNRAAVAPPSRSEAPSSPSNATAPPQSAPPPASQRPQPSVVAPKTQSDPIRIAPPRATTPAPHSVAAPRVPAPRVKSGTPETSPPPSAPLSPKAARGRLRAGANEGAGAAEFAPRADTFLGRENESLVAFSFQIKAAPAPKIAPGANAMSNRAAPAVAAPETQAQAPKSLEQATSDQVAPEAARPNIASGATGTRALRPTPRIALPSRVEKIAPGDGAAAFGAPNRENPAPVASNRVRRYEMQIEAPRTVSGAQIRLELPSSLRLVWPRSSVVWSGDLAPEKAATISFSLAEGRGGEKISVVVEQKSARRQSNILSTQILTLPAPERD